MAKKPTKAEQRASPTVSVAIEHQLNNIPAHYANHMLVQAGNREFYVSFFQVQPPIVLKGQEEKFQSLKSVQATCVARVVLPANMIDEVINAFATGKQMFRAMQSQRDAESPNQGDVRRIDVKD